IRLALLEADVNFKVVKDFIKKIKERADGADVMESLTPGQQVIKIVQEELTELMGGSQSKIAVSERPPTAIMMVGLQGEAKTTTKGKLDNLIRKKHNHKPLVVAGDVYRLDAIQQLKTLGEQLDMPVFEQGTYDNPVDIAKNSLEYAKENHHD